MVLSKIMKRKIELRIARPVRKNGDWGGSIRTYNSGIARITIAISARPANPR